MLAAKAIYDGVAFLARSCVGATRSSAPSPVRWGIEPLHRPPRCRYDPTEPYEGIVLLNILLCGSRNETPGFFCNPTRKMKLVLVVIDPDHIEFAADPVSAELFDLQ